MNRADIDVSIQIWRELSHMSQRALRTPFPSRINDVLREQIKADPNGILAPALLLWSGEHLQAERRFEEAIEIYSELLHRYPAADFGGLALPAIALQRSAVCWERLHRIEEAIAAYDRAARGDYHGVSKSDLQYEIGRLFEDLGDEAQAIRAYRTAAMLKDPLSHSFIPIAQLARSAAATLQSERRWFQATLEAVCSHLFSALEGRQAEPLSTVASQTQFTMGFAASDSTLVPVEAVLSAVGQDLAVSRVRFDPTAVGGCGGKRYLVTDGWMGKHFRGRVVFVITQSRYGWEWSGLALTELPESLETFFGPLPPPDTNQPLQIAIKAPWPAGMHFRAGGLVVYLNLVNAFRLSGVAGLFEAEAAATLDPCGFGFAGLYYNQAPTHNDAHEHSSFAIDFSRCIQGIAFENGADGIPVLAVADGCISNTISSNVHGSRMQENRVEITHMTAAEAAQVAMGHKVQPKYKSMYLHLDGPNKIPVCCGHHVVQGTILGFIDDTGNSAMSHLHFSIHDQHNQGMSVRPNPMDGQSLDDINDGSCIVSTNMPRV
jgi:tetratricopeptide (TPR) repeat protein